MDGQSGKRIASADKYIGRPIGASSFGGRTSLGVTCEDKARHEHGEAYRDQSCRLEGRDDHMTRLPAHPDGLEIAGNRAGPPHRQDAIGRRDDAEPGSEAKYQEQKPARPNQNAGLSPRSRKTSNPLARMAETSSGAPTQANSSNCRLKTVVSHHNSGARRSGAGKLPAHGKMTAQGSKPPTRVKRDSSTRSPSGLHRTAC
jgi:hypothetical protein